MTNFPKRGVIYAATGEAYVDVARRSARSLKKHCPGIHVTLFTDIDDKTGVFDNVVVMRDSHFRSKVDAIADSPYQETLFLDADTIIRADITELFALLDRFDICISRVVLWHRPGHQGYIDTPMPASYTEFNTGVVLYRRNEKMTQFLEDYRKLFYKHGSANDQIAMREMIWNSDVQFYVLPEQYNKRVFEASELIYTDRPKAKLFHLLILRPQKNWFKRWFSNLIR